MDELKLCISLRLRAIREKRGMSQVEASKQCKINTTQIAHYEGAERLPTCESLINLATGYHVSADYLLGLSSDDSWRF